MRDSSDETEELDTAYWQKTYEKQRRAQLRREERVKNETADVAETLRDIFEADIFEASKSLSESSTVPTHRSVPQVEPILSARYTSITPLVFPSASPTNKCSGSEVPQVPTTASPAAKPRGFTPSKCFSTDDSDAQSALCNSMCSLTVSSNPSYSISSSPLATPGKRKKYYVVSVGRCAGIFDNWPYVQSLMSGVTGSCQKSYATYNEALDVYQEMKAKGLVRIIRYPGDEITFGSIEDAMQ